MKILTTNFLTCAVRTCKTSPESFPLHPQSATLSRAEIDFNPTFLLNILPRINYDALSTVATELGLVSLLPTREAVEKLVAEGQQEQHAEALPMAVEQGQEEQEQVLKRLHTLLLETSIQDGNLSCKHCGFEYPVKEGVGNFLLPAHLV